MSRQTVVQVRCDLCDHGGAYTRPEDFVTIDGVDLCRWCVHSGQMREMSCGRHTVTFTDESWSCSCGEKYRRPFVPPRVAAAVPSMLNATANFHAQHS